jgi:uncharacterized metal-binding protein YceD (DUF177 family)
VSDFNEAKNGPAETTSALYLVDCSPLLAELPGASFDVPEFTLTSSSEGELIHTTALARVDRTNRGVRLIAHVRGVQEGACARCLSPARANLETSIDEEVLEERHSQDEGERLGRGNSVDLGRIAVEGLDLVRRLVLHCDPLCPERCGHCGAPHQPEECPGREVDPRLAALGSLFAPGGEEPGVRG